MLKGILDLENITIEDIMIPRNEMQGIDLEEPIDSIKSAILDSEYTRQPLYKGDINNIVGVFNTRKAHHLLKSQKVSHKLVRQLSEKAYFIPESTTLMNQLLNFRDKKARFGIVVDEYGEVQGLVTLEDILEEIVGDFTTDIADQIDEIHKISKDKFEIDGGATIREINKATGWSLPTDGPKTLNGLVLEQLENIPDGNISFLIDNYCFETANIEGAMVKKVSVSKLPNPSKKL